MIVWVELSISRKTALLLLDKAFDGTPDEVCGVIHYDGTITELPNSFVGDTRHGFDMEIDIEDGTVQYIWHSHPRGPDMPSCDDRGCMELLESHGYHFQWLIVAPRGVYEYEVKVA